MKFTLKCTPAEIVEKELNVLAHPGFTAHQIEVIWSLDISELRDIANNWKLDNADQETLIAYIAKKDPEAKQEFFNYYNEFYSVSEVV